MQPTSGSVSFTITNTTASNNGYAGVSYVPPSGSAAAIGVIDHVVTTNNGSAGIQIQTTFGGGLTSVAISNSIASNNVSYGISYPKFFRCACGLNRQHQLPSNRDGIFAGGTSEVTLGHP